MARPWCASKNLNLTEITVCKNQLLIELDAELQAIYDKAEKQNKSKGQIRWLRKGRDKCSSDVNCIESKYRNRIETLLIRTELEMLANSRPWCSSERLNATERTICLNSNLRDYDAQLQVVYGQARAKSEDSGQIYWLRRERDRCAKDVSCIQRQYSSRILILKNRLNKHRAYTTHKVIPNPKSDRGQCSADKANDLKAVCLIAAVGEYACASKIMSEFPPGALSSGAAYGICSSASAQLIDGSIDPEILGLTMASGFLNGAGDSLLESDDPFSAFIGVIFKIGSVSLTAVSVDKCFRKAETLACNYLN